MIIPNMWSVLFIAVLYTGFGFFLSRFLPATIRNNPLTWIFLTVTVFPLWVELQAMFIPWHAAAVAAAAVFAVIGVFMSLPGARQTSLFALPPLRPVSFRELCLYSLLLSVFLMAIVLPKLSLIQSTMPSIGDDLMRVKFVVSMGTSLTHPVAFDAPSVPYSYPYFDWVLPAVVFRTTPFSAQQAWFLHNIITAAGLLGCMLFVALSLLKTLRGRCALLLSCTFLGGFDVFVYRLAGVPVPTHAEWWGGLIRLFRHETFQISSPYTLFLWVPSHLIGACLFVLITMLALRPMHLGNRIAVAVLFGCLIGFSAFVFITAAASYAVAEAVLWSRQPSGARVSLLWASIIQACIFAAVALRMLLLFRGRGSVMWQHFLLFHFLDPAKFPGSIPGLGFVINALLTVSILLFVDMGVVALLGAAYFFLRHRAGDDAALRTRLAITCVVTLMLVFSFRSIGANDFFMRGITIVQMSLAIGAAFVIERMRPRPFVFALASVIVLLLQTTNFLNEFKGRTSFRRNDIPPVYAFMRDNTPKDAIIMTGDSHLCDAVSLLGNRVCPKNIREMNGQERAALGGRPAVVPHDLAGILALRLPPDTYLLSKQSPHNDALHTIFAQKGLVLSEILKH